MYILNQKHLGPKSIKVIFGNLPENDANIYNVWSIAIDGPKSI